MQKGDLFVGAGKHTYIPREGKIGCGGIIWFTDLEPALCNELKSAEIHATSAFETQVGGNHYKNLAIQPTEYIVKNGLNFVEGNIIKYVTRYKLKGGLEDLKKARHYLDLLIELGEGKDIGA